MGRRDHLLRIALAATKSQVQETVTPEELSGDEGDEETSAVTAKSEKIHELEAAQEAVFSAVGFITEADQLRKSQDRKKSGVFNLATVCGFVHYHLALPLSCHRNLGLVCHHFSGARADPDVSP